MIFAVGFVLFCGAAPEHAEKSNAVKLNAEALEYAKNLVSQGRFVADKKGAWSQHQPSVEEENEFIRRNGFGEYAKWHLGIDSAHAVNAKARYKFPYGDFKNVHRCAVLAALSRAGQYKYDEIENAAAQLKDLIEAKEKVARASSP